MIFLQKQQIKLQITTLAFDLSCLSCNSWLLNVQDLIKGANALVLAGHGLKEMPIFNFNQVLQLWWKLRAFGPIRHKHFAYTCTNHQRSSQEPIFLSQVKTNLDQPKAIQLAFNGSAKAWPIDNVLVNFPFSKSNYHNFQDFCKMLTLHF